MQTRPTDQPTNGPTDQQMAMRGHRKVTHKNLSNLTGCCLNVVDHSDVDRLSNVLA